MTGNKGRRWILALIITATIILTVVSFLVVLQYTMIEQEIEQQSQAKEYEYYFVMIVDDVNDPFWQSVYKIAKELAGEQNAFLELMGTELYYDYTREELLQIAVAGKVDGILIQADQDGMMPFINEAVASGIGVVTMLDDMAESNRHSYVGIGNYNLGQEYSKQIGLLAETGVEHILVLLELQEEDSSKNLIYKNILESTQEYGIAMDSYSIMTQNTFEIDETIRNIMINNEDDVDAIICTSATQTASVLQTLLNYSKVGDIQMIGYSSEDTVIEAVNKGIMEATFLIDSNAFATSCIQTLLATKQGERTSEYTAIPIQVVDGTNAEQFLKE